MCPRGVERPLVLAPHDLSPSGASPCLVMEGPCRDLAHVGSWPVLGDRTHSCLGQVWGEGFFNFLKILPPFVKGMGEGKSKHVSGGDTWLREGGVHCHVYPFFFFS